MSFEEILSVVKENCTHGEAISEPTMTPGGIMIHGSDLQKVCQSLREHPSLYCDMLSCVSVVDNGPDSGNMEVIYNLYSIPFNHHVALKVIVPRDLPEVDSVQHIWKTANWHEREAYDMFGIKFKGHPDLRRILLPADWEGHPLRKDYRQQEYYRGVKVEF